MKFKSQLVTQVSGSIGGTTFAHNRGGMYQRARSIPVNPNTTPQQEARNALSSVSTYWRSTLTVAERAAWTEYAANSPVTDVFGDPILLTGQQMFLRCMQPRVRAGLAIIDAAPTTYGVGTLTSADNASIAAAGTTFDLEFDETDAWLDEDGAALIVQAGRQQSPTINYFRGPFCLAGTVLGDSTTPPTSAATLSNPFATTYVNNNALFVRAVATLSDGRLTNLITYRGILAV